MFFNSSHFDKNELNLLEKQARDKGMIYRPDVQNLLLQASLSRNPRIYATIINRLRHIIDAYDEDASRKNDPFMPYCPKALSRSGDLRLMVQMDNTDIYINPDTLVTGMLIIGPVGSGKTLCIVHLCEEFQKIRPDVNITIISPKSEFHGLSQFKRIDLQKVSLDMTPPQGVNPADFIFEFMPILGSICGLIFGIEVLTEAAELALLQLVRFIQTTRQQTSLCIKDVAEALRSIPAKGFRKAGYKDAAETALELLLGKQNLFACRKGLPLEWLFAQNVILHAQSLTNPMQCQMLLLFLLYWFYRGAKLGGYGNKLRHVIIVDDASRFLSPIHSMFERHSITSPLGHILAVLREAGIAVIFVTQLPAQIDPSVLSLIRNIIVIGNINGEENLRIIKSCMSLNDEKKNKIIEFKPRETLAFISGHQWARPMHGWTPYVADLPKIYSSSDDYIDMIESWYSLKEISSQKAPEPEAVRHQAESPAPKSQSADDAWIKLVLDCINYLFDKVEERIPRCGMSVREYEVAKNQAVQQGFLLESSAGRRKYLIPTPKAYQKFSQQCPYERATSIEHAFYVLLTAHILKQKPEIASVRTEVPLGTSGSTIDVTSTDKSGRMAAYEVTLNTSNLLSNAAKLQDTAFVKIVWVCRDVAAAKAVKAYFNKTASLSKEFIEKFEYISFGKLQEL